MKRYFVAVISAVIAMMLSLLLVPVISHIPSMLFFGAVALSAAYGGLVPSLVTIVLSITFLTYFLPPAGFFSLNVESFLALGVFASISTVISMLYEQRKRAELSAHQQREAMRITLTSIGDAVITTDTHGRVTFLNPVAEQLTGWSMAEAKNKDISLVFTILNEYTRQAVESPVDKVLANGLIAGLANHTILIARDGSECAIDDSAAPIKDLNGNVSGVALTFRDISERRVVETCQELLIEASDWLASLRNYPAYNQPFTELATLLSRRFAVWCEIYLTEDGQAVRKALVHHDPAKQTLLEQGYKQPPSGWVPIEKVLQTGHIQQYETGIAPFLTTETNPQIVELWRDLDPTTSLYVPLQFDNQIMGVLGFHRTGQCSGFTITEADFTKELARRIAMALDNTRLYWATDLARQSAERNADRLARSQAITAALNSAQLPIDVARTIVDQARVAIDGVYGSMVALLVDERQPQLKIVYSAGYNANQMVPVDIIPLDTNAPLVEIVLNGQADFFRSNDDWLARFPNAAPWQVNKSLAALPLRIGGKNMGCLVVSFHQTQSFVETDRAFLLNLSDKCSQAMYRVQLYEREKQTREQIDAILEGISDGFFSFDNELRYTYVNSKAIDLIGLPREQLIGKHIQDIYPDHEADVFFEYAQRALTEKAPIEYERFSPQVNFWAVTRLYPYKGGLSVFLQDISARKKAEAEAQLYALQVKAFIESGVIGIIFARKDGQIVNANQKFLDMIGCSQAELEQGQLSWLRITPAEYTEQDQLMMSDVVQNGRPSTAEKEFFHKDGHRVPVLIGGIPVQDTWISFVLDLTDRKRAERRLSALTEASALLSTSLDYRTTLSRVAQIVVPGLADWCTIHLKDPDGTVQQVALAHKDPAKVAWGYQIQRDYPDDLAATTGLYQVIRSGQAEFYPDITDEMLVAAAKNDNDLLRLLREIGYSAVIIVPLKVQDRVVGAIQLVSAESRQRFSQEDLKLAEDMARRAAIAIDNAQLYNQVHQERERLQVTLASIGDAVIATDTRGYITFTNVIAASLTGWTQEEVIGKHVNEVFNLLNVETQERVESPLDKVLHNGSAISLPEQTVLVAKDGAHIPIDNSGAPIRGADGELIGVILVFRDVRIRREAEQRLAITFQRTADLYNTSRQIGIASRSADILSALLSSHYLQQTSQAAIITFSTPWQRDQPPLSFEIAAALTEDILPGFASNHLISDSPLLGLYTSDRSLYIQDMRQDNSLDRSIRQQLVAQNIASLILLPLWAGGDCFGLLALYCTEPYHWSNEDFEHIRIFADEVAIVMDNVRLFDAERIARQEAEYANQLKLKFLAMISHELRTPLTSIKGFTSSLLATDVTWDAESESEFITIIDQEADKLNDLIGQLLDLSQLQAGTMRIRPVVQTIQQIIDIAQTQLTMLTNSHQLAIALDPGWPPVLVDPQRIAQVITNLVGNATKYTPAGTEITISGAVLEGELQINVSDQGPGIPSDKRDIVFEAFHQLDRKSAQPSSGAGLGLAICKALVEAHHGRIWIGDAPTGTTISFTLPLANN